jgi:hypothetical protein
MSTKQIHVFISHSWSYSQHYDTLEKWTSKIHSRGQASLDLRNFSVPKNNPIDNANNDKELQEAIYNKIKLCHVIVIPTSMYTAYSKWIQKEIDGSKLYNKKILGVDYMGQVKTADVVTTNADKVVKWREDNVIDGIWELYQKIA